MWHPVGQGVAAPLNKQLRWPPILMYHAISRSRYDPNFICVSPERFESQMIQLKRRNLRGVSVQKLLRAMSAGESRHLVGLTFDDGYANFLSTALPILEKLGFSATVFVVSGMLGDENAWVDAPRMNLLSTHEIREVAEQGMEIGSHTLNHSVLSSDLGIKLLQLELSNSRKILNEVLDNEVEGVCYPWGAVDTEVIQSARQAGYTYACGGSAMGRGPEWGSLYNIPRIFVSEKDGPFRLSMKLFGYAQYTRVAHTFVARRAQPLIRKYLSKFWFGW